MNYAVLNFFDEYTRPYTSGLVFDMVNDLIDFHYERRFNKEYPKFDYKPYYKLLETDKIKTNTQLRSYRLDKIRKQVKQSIKKILIESDNLQR